MPTGLGSTAAQYEAMHIDRSRPERGLRGAGAIPRAEEWGGEPCSPFMLPEEGRGA